MSRLFLGKPIHWLILAIIIGVLAWLGFGLVQTRNFKLFLIVLLALTVGSVAVIMFTTKKGDRVTREPFGDDPPG
jgi:purine-cytosine permease-like protein